MYFCNFVSILIMNWNTEQRCALLIISKSKWVQDWEAFIRVKSRFFLTWHSFFLYQIKGHKWIMLKNFDINKKCRYLVSHLSLNLKIKHNLWLRGDKKIKPRQVNINYINLSLYCLIKNINLYFFILLNLSYFSIYNLWTSIN